jgi:hypothetical protein
MEVDATQPDSVSARHGQAGFAATSQQPAEQQDGSTLSTHQFGIDLFRADLPLEATPRRR